ncbi:MAG: restriction endonuclease subunit S [Nitrospirae bacterium]|nr:restriction endonuclease subunit S [Nitrospirota bacterium]
MKRWPNKPLGELLKIQNGFAFKSELFNDDGKGLPIIRIRDLARGFSETFYDGEHDPAFEVENGDFLIGMDGEFHCYRWQGGKALLNQRVCRLQNFSRDLNAGYVFYGINDHLREIEDNTAFVTVKHLSSKQIASIEMSVPPLEEQERLVKLLDETDELRKLRAQADRRTATLIPSLFSKMFGPDAPGSVTWQTATVAELAAAHEGSIRTGPFGSDLRHSEFFEEGVPVLGIDNVVENEFRWTKSRCIPESKFAEMKRFVVFPGDVLVTIMGTVGRCSIAPEGLPVCISTKHLCTITLDRTKAHPRFIWGAFLHDASVKQQTRSVGKGAIMEGWNSTIIKRLRLRVPPLTLQKQFAARVSEIRAMKIEQAASRRRLDDLFQSILHHAFNGEL